jgi:fumarate reductase subunit C
VSAGVRPGSARRPHRAPVSRTWFLTTREYRAYALRETSSVVVGLFVLDLVVGLVSAHRGVDAFTRWVELQASPPVVALAVVALVMAVVHAVTWFQATPAIIRVRRGRRHLHRAWVVLAHYVLLAAFAVVVVLWLGRS